MSLSILLLVPFDIFSTRDPGNGAGVPIPELATAFGALYYTACILAFVVGPVHLGIVNSPEFGTRARLRAIVRKNLLLAGVGAAAGVIILGWIVVYKRVDIQTLLVLVGSVKVIYNSYGLVLGVLLLSYGLVEVPRWAWRQLNAHVGQERAFQKLSTTSDKVWSHYSDLSEAMAVVASLQRQIHRRDKAKPLLNIIEREGQGILAESVEVEIGEQDLDYEPDEEGMTALRARVLAAAIGYQRRRARYMESLKQARSFKKVIDRRRDRPTAALVRDAAWTFVALATASLSLAILVAEATLPLKGPDLSVPSLLVRGLVQNEYLTQLGSLVPLAYMAASSYFSISMSRFFGSHSLLLGFSDSSLLLEDAALVNKFLPALCYNYLLVTKMSDSALANTAIDTAVKVPVLPVADGAFNLWYPMVGVLFSFLTVAGLWDRILGPVRRLRRSLTRKGGGDDSDDDDYDLDEEYQGGSEMHGRYGYTALSVEEGRRMFQEEREAVAAGGQWGDALLERMRERLETEQRAKRKPQRGGFFSSQATEDRSAPEPSYRERAAKLLEKKRKKNPVALFKSTSTALGRLLPFQSKESAPGSLPDGSREAGEPGSSTGRDGRRDLNRDRSRDRLPAPAPAPRTGRARSDGLLGGLPKPFGR